MRLCETGEKASWTTIAVLPPTTHLSSYQQGWNRKVTNSSCHSKLDAIRFLLYAPIILV